METDLAYYVTPSLQPQFLMVALGVNISDAQVVPAGALWDLNKQRSDTINCKNDSSNKGGYRFI